MQASCFLWALVYVYYLPADKSQAVVHGVQDFQGRLQMGKSRMMSMVFTCLLAAVLAVSANAEISDTQSSDKQSVTFGGGRATPSSQQVAVTGPISEEVTLIGAAVIGLIGITIMRKTLH